MSEKRMSELSDHLLTHWLCDTDEYLFVHRVGRVVLQPDFEEIQKTRIEFTYIRIGFSYRQSHLCYVS